ncbi:MAG: hypothetical protein K5848_01180 [Lachnospiraceae bacterium]|nr:hypothetical protein [Lachnospiraceae bacterium]
MKRIISVIAVRSIVAVLAAVFFYDRSLKEEETETNVNEEVQTAELKNDTTGSEEAAVKDEEDGAAVEGEPTVTIDGKSQSKISDNNKIDPVEENNSGNSEEKNKICLNDYIDIEVVSADSEHLTYRFKEGKEYDRIDEWDHFSTGEYVVVQGLNNGEWADVNSYLPIPELPANVRRSETAIAIGIRDVFTEKEHKFSQINGIPDGHYRIVKKIFLCDADGNHLSTDTNYYVSTEFDIPTGEQG